MPTRRFPTDVPIWLTALALSTVPGLLAQEHGAPAPGSDHSQIATVPRPESVFGFRIGADGELADWSQIVDYLTALSESSERVRMEEIGRSVGGRPVVLMLITSAANHARLEEIRRSQERLADPRRLTDAEHARLLREQPAVVFVGASLHGNEIMGTQMAVELAHELATADQHASALDDVIVLLVPSMNPDGLEITRDWFLRTRETEHAAAPMPWLYHHYTGHDNNRDFYMVTQPETEAVTRLLYQRWFPLLVWDVHEMGNLGERFFLPPFADPLNPNLDPLLVRLTNLVGVQIAADMTAAGLTGISHRERFDLWWHGGGRTVPARHNMIGLLTEAASVRYADPVYQPASSLQQPRRGSLYPEPWQGGWWRARDIVEYELAAARSLLALMHRQRERFVRDKIELARRQIALGQEGHPFAYAVPPGQTDEAAAAELLRVLRRGAVEVHEALEPFSAGHRSYPAGTRLVLMAQPYRAHAKDLLEMQSYPEGSILAEPPTTEPYDLAGWTLPLQMGVEVHEISEPFSLPSLTELDLVPVRPAPVPGRASAFALDPGTAHAHRAAFEVLRAGGSVTIAARPLEHAAGGWPAGTTIVGGLRDLQTRAARWATEWGVTARPLGRADGHTHRRLRVGLYQPWTASSDEGWTRWLFEEWGVPFESMRDSVVRAGGLRSRFDTVVLPAMRYAEIRSGLSGAHPDYGGGLGSRGVEALREFVEAGGTLVLLGSSSDLALRDFAVPLRDVTADPDLPTRWHAPGSLLRVEWDRTHPLAAGMPAEGAVFYSQGPVFEIVDGAAHARAIARYPREDVLLSGFARGESVVAGHAAAVEVRLGAGRLVLFGFRPQHRGQSHGTFRVLFNSLYPS
jgi:hypothetical protein